MSILDSRSTSPRRTVQCITRLITRGPARPHHTRVGATSYINHHHRRRCHARSKLHDSYTCFYRGVRYSYLLEWTLFSCVCVLHMYNVHSTCLIVHCTCRIVHCTCLIVHCACRIVHCTCLIVYCTCSIVHFTCLIVYCTCLIVHCACSIV